MRQEEKSALLTLRTVTFSEARDAVIILDQTQLPAREVYVSLRTAEDIWGSSDRDCRGLWYRCLHESL